MTETLGLIGDLVDCCNKDVVEFMKKPFIESLITHCSAHNMPEETREAASWAMSKIKENC